MSAHIPPRLAVNAGPLTAALGQIIHAIDNGDARPILAQLLIEIPRPTKRDPSPGVTLVTCDNYRIATVTIPEADIERTGTLPAQLLVPRAIVIELEKALRASRFAAPALFAGDADGSWTVTVAGGRGWTFRPIDGQYPNWRAVGPDRPEKRQRPIAIVGVTGEYLAQVARAFTAKPGKNGSVRDQRPATLIVEIRKPRNGMPAVLVIRPQVPGPVEYLMPVRITEA